MRVYALPPVDAVGSDVSLFGTTLDLVNGTLLGSAVAIANNTILAGAPGVTSIDFYEGGGMARAFMISEEPPIMRVSSQVYADTSSPFVWARLWHSLQMEDAEYWVALGTWEKGQYFLFDAKMRTRPCTCQLSRREKNCNGPHRQPWRCPAKLQHLHLPQGLRKLRPPPQPRQLGLQVAFLAL